jgi:hypothetical protein
LIQQNLFARLILLKLLCCRGVAAQLPRDILEAEIIQKMAHEIFTELISLPEPMIE